MHFYVLHEQNYRIKLFKFPQEKLVFDHAIGAVLQTSRKKVTICSLKRKKKKEFLQIYGSCELFLWSGRTKSATSLKLWNGYDLNHWRGCCRDSTMCTPTRTPVPNVDFLWDFDVFHQTGPTNTNPRSVPWGPSGFRQREMCSGPIPLDISA